MDTVGGGVRYKYGKSIVHVDDEKKGRAMSAGWGSVNLLVIR